MQNVGTPRFYIDSGLYQQAIGAYAPDPDQVSLVQLNPSNIVDKPLNSDGSSNHVTVPRISPIKYLAILGHNGGTMYPEWVNNDNTYGGTENLTEIINAQPYASNTEVEHEGYSIWTFNDNESWENLRAVLGNNFTTAGAVSIGDYWDAPTSPDLKVRLSYIYDGVKNVTTKGGATLSNASYLKSANWGDRGAWQLGSDEAGNPISNLRSGRRECSLSWSFIDHTDIMAKVAATTNYGAGDYEVTADPSENTLLDGTDFFSVVYNRVFSSHLSFIFNPNGGGTSPNNSPDQFAICRFVGNSLKITQTMFRKYSLKIKIRECW